MSDKQWTTDEIAADIDKESKFKAPEQIDVQTRLARRVVELKAKLATIEAAARRVCFTPMGDARRVPVRVRDLKALDALIGEASS